MTEYVFQCQFSALLVRDERAEMGGWPGGFSLSVCPTVAQGVNGRAIHRFVALSRTHFAAAETLKVFFTGILEDRR